MCSIVYMSQEIFLFPGTIRDNLAWAMLGVDKAFHRDAPQRATADFVLKLPHGLDTTIGHSGVGRSGGERQRTALARALPQDTALLVLDEAPTALFAANPGRVLESISALRGKWTVLLIGQCRGGGADFPYPFVAHRRLEWKPISLHRSLRR